MRWVLLALGLGGCQLVYPLTGGDPVDGPPGDGDGDAATLLDEDGDGIPDKQDNCPSQSNANQLTNDGDLVGDICDPDPASGLEAIILTEHFTSEEGNASPSGSGWAFDGGFAIPTGASVENINTSLKLVVADNNRTGISVELGFEIVDFGLDGNQNQLSLRVMTPSNTLNCFISEDSPANGESFGMFTHASGGGGLIPAPVIVRDKLYRMIVHGHETDGTLCVIESSRRMGTGNAEGNIEITIGVERMRARIHYVVVYETTRL